MKIKLKWIVGLFLVVLGAGSIVERNLFLATIGRVPVFEKIKNFFGSEFPDDDNGNVLRRMKKEGADLSKPYDIDFEHLFESEKAASAMQKEVAGMGYKSEVDRNEEEKGWDCRVVVHMKPTYEDITNTEEALGKVAEKHGGHSDGWGMLY